VTVNDIDVFRKMNRASRQQAHAAVSANEPTPTTAATSSIAAVPDQIVAETLHKELLETCIDMLLRYTYFHSSSLPQRFVGIVLPLRLTRTRSQAVTVLSVVVKLMLYSGSVSVCGYQIFM